MIALSYGAPRSGTTFLWLLLRSSQAYRDVLKLAEFSPYHPVMSCDGLMRLTQMFESIPTEVCVVRSVRHPMAIARSLYGILTATGQQHQVPEIGRVIRNEHACTQQQRAMLQDRLTELRYEAFDDPQSITWPLELRPYVTRCLRYIDQHWRKTYSCPSQSTANVASMPIGLEEQLRGELASVAAASGYDIEVEP